MFGTSGQFYGGLLVGVAVWLATWGQHPMLRVLLASDMFFAVFVCQMVAFSVRATPERLRVRATEERSGSLAMVLFAAAAVMLSLVAIFTLLNHPYSEGRLFPVVAVLSVPLSWAMIHTVAAFHYAQLYYAPTRAGGAAGGLGFPAGATPSALDFLYYAVVIGTSFSVSDVATLSPRLRLATMVHSIASFTFNTVLIAVAVNAAMAFAR